MLLFETYAPPDMLKRLAKNSPTSFALALAFVLLYCHWCMELKNKNL